MTEQRRRAAHALALLLALVLFTAPAGQVRSGDDGSARSPSGAVTADITAHSAPLETNGRQVVPDARGQLPIVVGQGANGQSTSNQTALTGSPVRINIWHRSVQSGGSIHIPFSGAAGTSWWGRAPPHA